MSTEKAQMASPNDKVNANMSQRHISLQLICHVTVAGWIKAPSLPGLPPPLGEEDLQEAALWRDGGGHREGKGQNRHWEFSSVFWK